MTRKKHDSKTVRQIRRERLKDDAKLLDRRAAEKQASRDRDEADLASGRKTREQLWEENSMFSGVAHVELHRPLKAYPDDLGKRTVQGVLIDETQWEGHDL